MIAKPKQILIIDDQVNNFEIKEDLAFGGNRSLFMGFKVPQNWGI